MQYPSVYGTEAIIILYQYRFRSRDQPELYFQEPANMLDCWT